MPSNTPKADAIAAAQQKRDAASARWSKAAPAEQQAYESAKFGDQLRRLDHADALDELRGARQDTLDADDAMSAAQALPKDPTAPAQ